MGFISYSTKYYSEVLRQIEIGAATPNTIYTAKQLLKMLDDLTDEGYTELYLKIEEAFRGATRLRKYLNDNGAEPFEACIETVKETDVIYGEKDQELTEAINAAIENAENVENAENSENKSKTDFLQKLNLFCKWIGYEKNTAYIFLLRDTMLPYIYYKAKNRTEIHPWLLGRKTLELLAGKEGADDDIRASVIKALELGRCKDFDGFCSFVLPDIRKTLCNYPQIKGALTELLNEISEEHIIVVESGCYGTFPMLLMSMDNRADMRMYTTVPYLADIYKDKIFTTRYEENRNFETLYSQNLYLRFSDLREKNFYVKKCENAEVNRNALAEIKAMLK